MSQNLWQPLQQGDVIDIVAPGMRPVPGVLEGIASFLESWGIEARFPKDLLGRSLICSNSKKNRSEHLRRALAAKDSRMVWCVRGGYGSLHLLDDLQKVKPPPTKLFMGLSDCTTLHTFMVQNWGWSTVHGSHIDRFVLKKAQSAEEKRFKKLLFGHCTQVEYKLKALNHLAEVSKPIKSSVIGGNLITLQAGFGTKHQVNLKGKLLFIEDIGERAYRVDRVLEHMRQLSMYKGIKGVLIGQFTGGREPDGKELVPRLLREFAKEAKFPVFSGLKCGHGPDQHPLPLGTPAVITGGSKPVITLETGVACGR